MIRNCARASAVAVAAAVVSACGSNQSGVQRTPVASRVCAALPSADVNAAAALGVGPGVATPDGQGCMYANASDGAAVTVLVDAGGASRYGSLRSTQGAFDVSGVGDRAFAVASGGGIVTVDIYAVRLSDVLVVTISAPESVADVEPATRDAEKVARVALQKV